MVFAFDERMSLVLVCRLPTTLATTSYPELRFFGENVIVPSSAQRASSADTSGAGLRVAKGDGGTAGHRDLSSTCRWPKKATHRPSGREKWVSRRVRARKRRGLQLIEPPNVES
jgi:hypothetical protein